MVTPAMPPSASPTWPNTWSRAPGTTKPLFDAAGAWPGALLAPGRCVADASAGTFIAAEVSGAVRSGGTSSGRISGASA